MLYIGVDLGGTGIKAGVVNERGEILSKGSTPTMKERPYQAIIRDIAALCEDVAKQANVAMADIAAIGVGVPTLRDITAELLKPGRDVRDELPKPILRTDVLEMKDLKPGMELTGTVRNVIDFGVFVDIGVHQDGLVHISQVADKFIRHPSEVVSVGDIVKVVVLDVDEKKKRISLSMRQAK